MTLGTPMVGQCLMAMAGGDSTLRRRRTIDENGDRESACEAGQAHREGRDGGGGEALRDGRTRYVERPVDVRARDGGALVTSFENGDAPRVGADLDRATLAHGLGMTPGSPMVEGFYWVRLEGTATIAAYRPREPHWKVTETVVGHWTLLGQSSVLYWRSEDAFIEVLAGPLSLSVEQTANALQKRIERALDELSRDSFGMKRRVVEILKGQRQ